MSKWSTETTMKFVREYKKQQCLWDFKSAAYKNKNMREAAYLQLVEAMNINGFGVYEVKNKIKNLRSTFNQEKKKIEASRNSGSGLNSLYVSHIPWLKELEPTMNVPENRKTFNNIIEEQPMVEPKSEPPEIETVDNSPSPPPKRKARTSFNAVNDLEHLHASINDTVDEEDSFDAFGNSVAKQLRKLSEERALLAQSAIQSLLTDYGIQDLRERNRLQPRRH